MAKGKSTQVMEISVAKLAKLLPKIPAHVAIMLWGSPGIGKTGVINTVYGEDMGATVHPILAGCSDPTDFGGIPNPMKDVPAFEHVPPYWAYLASSENPNPESLVLFFDDVVTADEQTQAALYKATHERRVGRLFFRNDVRMVFAGNRVDDKSAANDMPLALGNRMLHFNVSVDYKEWVQWAVGAGIHPMVVAYIRTQPQHINTFFDAVKGNIKAFATPRTWHLLSDTLKAFGETGISDDERLAVCGGLVGEGVATEFCGFLANVEGLIPPDVILRDPEKAPVPPKEKLDLLHATVSSLEAAIQQKPTVDTISAGLIYGMRLVPELGIVLGYSVLHTIMDSKNIDAKEKAKAMQAPAFRKTLEKWGKYF